MSTAEPTPIPTQTPPPALSRALNLLDGLILRTDVPTAVRIRLGEVFEDLVDVRPLYPPTTATDSEGRPWPAVAHEVVEALRELVTQPGPDTPPAVVLRHALAVRALRDAVRADGSPDSPSATP
ncbi:hypothetical protein [Jannaschia sp. R86511]|uniref:hypothetical protein n=1 Tax=Jannaschia sp. R86511 TaxID=3093853 RepID=UPI0036D35515